MSDADVIVVGAGVVGLTCSLELARNGRRVLLVDKEDRLAAEGTGASYGSLRVQGRHPAELPLATRAMEWWQRPQIAELAGIRRGGNAYVATDPGEVPELRRHLQTARDHGLDDVHLLSADEARTVVPGLEGNVAAVLYSPRDCQIEAGPAAAALGRLARSHGVDIRLGTRVTNVNTAHGRVRGVSTDNGSLTAERVVLACGVWSRALLGTVGVDLPIKVVATTLGETSPVAPFLNSTLRSVRYSVRQRTDGVLVLGGGLAATVVHRATLDDFRALRTWLPRLFRNRDAVRISVDWPTVRRQLRNRRLTSAEDVPTRPRMPAPRTAMMRAALATVHEQLPASRDAVLTRCWTGLIDLSPDGLPVVDASLGATGLVLVAGLNGHGLALGPALGECAAALAEDREPPSDITPFAFARFAATKLPMPERMV